MPGPLPKPDRRRTNKPTIPTTTLPATGYAGPYPKAPRWASLGSAGKAWWHWAWRTPQASAWSAGDLDTVAHRAELADDLAALTRADSIDMDAIAGDNGEAADLLRRLLALATGKLGILREARELDDRLGLTPKGRLALRMTIIEADEPTKVAQPPRGRRLRAVDSATA